MYWTMSIQARVYVQQPDEYASGMGCGVVLYIIVLLQTRIDYSVRVSCNEQNECFVRVY